MSSFLEGYSLDQKKANGDDLAKIASKNRRQTSVSAVGTDSRIEEGALEVSVESSAD